MVYCIVSLKTKELKSEVIHISKTLDDCIIELYHIIKGYDIKTHAMNIMKDSRIEVYNKAEGYIYGYQKDLCEILEICQYSEEIN